MLVVDRRQGRRDGFFRLECMVQVGPRVVPTGVAVAFRINRFERATVRTSRDVESSVEGVQGSVARHPRRGNAIEGVGACLDCREEVPRLTDSE